VKTINQTFRNPSPQVKAFGSLGFSYTRRTALCTEHPHLCHLRHQNKRQQFSTPCFLMKSSHNYFVQSNKCHTVLTTQSSDITSSCLPSDLYICIGEDKTIIDRHLISSIALAHWLRSCTSITYIKQLHSDILEM